MAKSWGDYKKEAKKISPFIKQDIEEMEILAELVSAIIERRNELGISQRELASMCNIPQSSIARIETQAVKPNLNTLIKVMDPLNLKLSIVSK